VPSSRPQQVPSNQLTAKGGSEIVIVRAGGAVLEDADGRCWTDYALGGGVNLLGHANRVVVLAAKKHAERGIHFGMPCRAQEDFSAFLAQAVPAMEQSVFFPSETEVLVRAVSLARSATGRRRVVSFQGMSPGYHQWQMALGPDGDRTTREFCVVPFNDVPALRRVFQESAQEIAAILVEPVMLREGIVRPTQEFLSALSQLRRQSGCWLIADETLTGFRVFPGALSILIGMEADLICLGGVVGGGFSLGILGGARSIMGPAAPAAGFEDSRSFPGPVVLRTGLMTLRLMTPRFFDALNRKAQRFSEEMNVWFQNQGISAHLERFYAVMYLSCSGAGQSAQERAAWYGQLRNFLLSRGIYLPACDREPFFVSGAHTKKDLSCFKACLKDFFGNAVS